MPTKIWVGTDPNSISPISSLCTMVSKEKSPEFIYKKFPTPEQDVNNMLQRAYNIERYKT